MRFPISDVSNPDHARDCRLPAADRQAEPRRGSQSGSLEIRERCSRVKSSLAPPPREMLGTKRKPSTVLPSLLSTKPPPDHRALILSAS